MFCTLKSSLFPAGPWPRSWQFCQIILRIALLDCLAKLTYSMVRVRSKRHQNSQITLREGIKSWGKNSMLNSFKIAGEGGLSGVVNLTLELFPKKGKFAFKIEGEGVRHWKNDDQYPLPDPTEPTWTWLNLNFHAKLNTYPTYCFSSQGIQMLVEYLFEMSKTFHCSRAERRSNFFGDAQWLVA